MSITHVFFQRLLRTLTIGLSTLLLAACALTPQTKPGALKIDRSVQAKSQNSRVQVIVLHYTTASNERSLELLSHHNVSSHYLITDEPAPHVYQLVNETRRAWHAGLSQWYGRSDINTSSIGIELVNYGRVGSDWTAWNPAQIDTLIRLLQDIAQRHQIQPHNIVGHSDIAPQRKTDPGPLFPWKKLADAGLGRWYDESLALQYQSEFERQGLPDTSWVQQQLERVGYAAPQDGKPSKALRNTLGAFQMHYRPALYDGKPDAQTLAILKSLR